MAVLATCALVASAEAGSEPAPVSPLFGAWAVDTARLPLPPAARPKSVTITFSPVGTGQLRTLVEVVNPAGVRLVADGTTPLDGTPTPVPANFESDESATSMPRPDVLIMQLAKAGKPASTRIFAVDAAGTTLVETVVYFSAEGKPVLRKNYFSRVQ